MCAGCIFFLSVTWTQVPQERLLTFESSQCACLSNRMHKFFSHRQVSLQRRLHCTFTVVLTQTTMLPLQTTLLSILPLPPNMHSTTETMPALPFPATSIYGSQKWGCILPEASTRRGCMHYFTAPWSCNCPTHCHG